MSVTFREPGVVGAGVSLQCNPEKDATMRKSESSEPAFLPAIDIAATRERDMQSIVHALSALAEVAQNLKDVPLRRPRAEDLMGLDG